MVKEILACSWANDNCCYRAKKTEPLKLDDICGTHDARGLDFALVNGGCCDYRAVLCSVTFVSAASMETSAVNYDSDLISVVACHRDGD